MEQSPQGIQELKQCLLNATFQCANSPLFVISKFCQALAAFMIHSTPDHWADPLCSLRTTIEENRAHYASVGLDYLFLEFLSAIVEQVQKSQLAKEKRCEVPVLAHGI